MSNITAAAIAVCIIICGGIIFFYHRKQRRMTDRIGAMLESAIRGDFTEHSFDESVYSSIENQFAKYLISSEMSMKSISVEKDKIKTLIADISHQTKTPISNILLYSELIGEAGISGEAAEYLKAMRFQTEKLSFLISSLVKLSRLETGIVTLDPKPGNVNELAESVAGSYAGKAAAKGLNLNVEPFQEELTAMFDEKWTAEALGNIIDNAVKYTAKGSVDISIRKYEMFIAVEIRDTGEGISEYEIPKIFSRFYRGEDTGGFEGVGIGLYLAREIISGEGGYIKVTSQKGKGSCFAVFLPSA